MCRRWTQWFPVSESSSHRILKKIFLFEAGRHLLLTANQSVLFGFLKYARKSLKYTNFGLDCGMWEFFKYSIRAVIQRTIVDFPALLEHGAAKKITVVHIQTVIRTSKRLDSVCMKRLRTLKSFQKLKTKIKKKVDDLFKAYPMILLSCRSGRTVPSKTTFNYLPDCQ
jgi:hypothetical protein